MTFGSSFFLKVDAKLKRLTVSVALNDERPDEDQLTHSSGLVTVETVEMVGLRAS